MDDNFLFNCSVEKYDKALYNLTEDRRNISSVKHTPSEIREVVLDIVLGIFIVVMVDVIPSIYIKYSDRDLSAFTFLKIFNTKNLLRTLILTIVVLLLPIVTVFLFLAVLYKVLCFVIIRRIDKKFVGFLDNFDVFWSLDDSSTRNTITILGVIESESPQALADNMTKKLQEIFPNNATKKIFYRRTEKYGFYYWREYSFVDMDQYVEIIDFSDKVDEINVTDLENQLTEVENQLLPYDDKALFKILITRQRISSHDSKKQEYGIIFKVHHAVGDGVALIEFLCGTFADKTEGCSAKMFTMPVPHGNRSAPNNILDKIRKLLKIPLCFVDGILRKHDASSIHGPPLQRTKVFKWIESNENLLKMVKEINSNVKQMTSTAVLLNALSTGLQKYFAKKMDEVPENVAVILPVRFPKSSTAETLQLQNNSGVTIVDVPIRGDKVFEKINKRSSGLRTSADPLTNYYMIKIVTNILPKWILHPVLNSSQATMVFSNLPGSEYLSICGGNVLKSMVFFIPNKGTTGLGITALSYGGVLRFAAMADAGLVSSSEELALILDGMVEEIRRLHKLYVTL